MPSKDWRSFPKSFDDDPGVEAMREFFVENMEVFRHLSRTDPDHATDRAMAGSPDWTKDERMAWDVFIRVINDRRAYDLLPDYWQAFINEILDEIGLDRPLPDGLHRTKGVTDQ